MAKNVEMNYKGESAYEIVYPNVTAKSIIDFEGENPLLTASTAELYNLGSGTVPNDIFAYLSNAILLNDDGKIIDKNGNNIIATQIFTGSYYGDGNYGQGAPNSLTFLQKPFMVIIAGYSGNNLILYEGQNSWIQEYNLQTSWSNNGLTVSWFSDRGAKFQFNEEGEYLYLLFV